MSETFLIDAPRFDPVTGLAAFPYRLGHHRFVETLELPPARVHADHPAFARLLGLTAFVLGTSYFKLRAPLVIAAPEIALTGDERDFVIDVYENGLGEFYARNTLERFGRLEIEAAASSEPAVQAPDLRRRAMLPIGGGKDSMVSVQLLEAAGEDFTPFAVNPKGPIVSCIEAIGCEAVTVPRRLDPEMLRLSREPGYYNGHVPSTAINSMIAALCALLCDHDTIVLSNERSASEGNVVFDGREANHQYSKSLDFETRIAATLSAATGGALRYFSLLRPFSEARIGALFARSTRYDRVFSSCNSNFRIAGHDGPLWCGKCPKCHFVSLVLAPFMSRVRLTGIFEADPLDTMSNERSYRELTGLAGQKPWECVGEILEAAACLNRLASMDEWQDVAIVRALAPDLLAQYGYDALERAWSDLMVDSPRHFAPPNLLVGANHGA